VTALPCSRRIVGKTCIESLADGGNTPQDLCPPCTRAFMAALDGITGPLRWHPAFHERAAE
jgi:hypothetical protein